MPRMGTEEKQLVPPPLRSSNQACQQVSLPVSSLSLVRQGHAGMRPAHAATPIVFHRQDNASPRRPTSSPAVFVEDEEEEEEDSSPFDEVDDADLFPSPLVTSKRWARPQTELHEAVADAIAEEEAAANWSGSLEQTERVQYVDKGKAKVVDVCEKKPSRYRGSPATVAERPVSGSGAPGGEMTRRDTLDEDKGKGRVGGDVKRVSSPWPLADGSGSRGPVVAISGLRR
jgi:hypothetical protein